LPPPTIFLCGNYNNKKKIVKNDYATTTKTVHND
jgi:hypothetical protein